VKNEKIIALGSVLALAVCGCAGMRESALLGNASKTRKTFDIREFGAVGDGRTLDTAAINKAVEACAVAGGGRVVFPAGKYLSGTVRLKSGVTLHIEHGATLLGSPDRKDYEHFNPPPKAPAAKRPIWHDLLREDLQLAAGSQTPESKWPIWHQALIMADGAENIGISGQGTIDGNKVFDPDGEEHMRGPHTILLSNCRDVTIRDVTIKDSGNYAILFELTDKVAIRNVKITGGWDGVHFRGRPELPCREVTITGCQFFTGDDSIAGRYWDKVKISDCVINSSCNCIRLIGPATHLTIERCRMYGPGEQPHRTSNRTNCLAGLNLQPGSWGGSQGRLDDVTIRDITMQNVSTPFHFVLRPGNTAGRITVSRVKATGVYFAASSVESWTETPFEDVTFRDVTIEYAGGGKREQAGQTIEAPGYDARPLPAWGFYLRNVKKLTLDHVRLSCVKDDLRPVFLADRVEQLIFQGMEMPKTPGVDNPVVFKDVKRFEKK
jgi:hypothetical protein